MKHLLLTFAVAMLFASLSLADSIRIVTMNLGDLYFAPKDGRISGAYADLYREAAEIASVTLTMEIMPWSRAVSETQRIPNTYIFPFTRNEEREHSYYWLAKTSETYVCFASQDGAVTSLEQARQLPKIVVHHNTSMENFLTKHDFKNLALIDRSDQALRILNREPKAAWFLTCEASEFFKPLEEDPKLMVGPSIETEYLYLAGGIKVHTPQPHILRFQRALKSLVEQGRLDYYRSLY